VVRGLAAQAEAADLAAQVVDPVQAVLGDLAAASEEAGEPEPVEARVLAVPAVELGAVPG
jgi:hypothetical protein